MKKILAFIASFVLLANTSQSQELSIEKQLVGIVGAISGTVKTETRTLKAGDKIYLNETIYAGAGSGTQLLLLDQSTFTIGADSEVLMDTFIYDPKTNDGKIVATVKEGSLKVISGLISKKDPDSLTVKVPEGTLGSRGTEFQTIVSRKNKRTDTLLIGPGKNNTLGLRPGAVLVGNKFGNTMLNNPYTFASMTSGKKPGKAKQISQGQLKKFKKRMKALRTAKMEGASKEEKKAIRKKIRKELKEAGLDKEEIKTLIKQNIKIDKEKRIVLLKERGEDVSDLETPDQSITEETTIEQDVAEPETPEVAEPKVEPKEPKQEKAKENKKKKKKKVNKKKKKEKAKKKKGKKKKEKAKKKGKKKKEKAKKKGKKKKATKKKATKKKATKKKATKKKATKKKAKKKKAVKKKAKKKKVVKKKAKKKKVVKKKKKKKVVKKKKKKKVVKKKPKKRKKVVKKKVKKKKKKRRNKRVNKK
jgi:hypothetical protein